MTTVRKPRNERREPDPAKAAALMRDRSTADNECDKEPGKKCMLPPMDRHRKVLAVTWEALRHRVCERVPKFCFFRSSPRYQRGHRPAPDARSLHPDCGPRLRYIRNTPNFVSGIGALSAAEKASPSTRRVSCGVMTPSSHSRAVA